MLEVLDRPLVLLRRGARCKRPQVLPLACLVIGMAAIDAKFTGFELSNHVSLDASRLTYNPRTSLPSIQSSPESATISGPRERSWQINLKEIAMKYILTWTERPQGSPIEYENAQKRRRLGRLHAAGL
jgi:hypothetical protein